MDAQSIHQSQALEELALLADVYASVEFFHPDVAPYPEARRRWNESVAEAVEEIAEGRGALKGVLSSLLGTLDDPLTTVVTGDRAPVPRPGGAALRAWRYRGFPPQVEDPYGGSYRPFDAGWAPLPAGVNGIHRIELSQGLAALIRYAEPVPAEGLAAPGRRDDGLSAPISDAAAEPPSYPRPGDRVIAAYRIRAVARYFHPYADLAGTDWDRALREAIPRLLDARDAAEYALAIATMASELHDTHVGLQGPGWSAAVDGPRPPVGTKLLESGVVVITGFSTDSVREASGLERGDVVLAVDGRPIDSVVDSLAGLFAASTPQASRRQVAIHILGRGPEASTVRVRVRSADAAERVVEIGRTADGWWNAYAADRQFEPAIRWLTPRIAYMDLTRLDRSQVDSAFAAVGAAAAIVFDMRGYPRGTAWAIAPRLADQDSLVASGTWTPIVSTPDPDAAEVESGATYVPYDPEAPRYSGLTVMLIDGSAQSQAEYTAMMFRAAAGTLFVGSPTSGANGDITDIALPGGLRLSFTGNGARWPDRRQLQRRGVAPDILVPVTLEGIRAGRDEQLERAVAVLEAALGGP